MRSPTYPTHYARHYNKPCYITTQDERVSRAACDWNEKAGTRVVFTRDVLISSVRSDVLTCGIDRSSKYHSTRTLTSIYKRKSAVLRLLVDA